MSEPATIPFRKMNGLGNDFVVLDARGGALRVGADAARAIADRDAGIGCDQLIVIERARSPGEHAHMRIWNRDGGEVESCGNAARCIADVLMRESVREPVVIGSRGGSLVCTRAGAGLVSVDMGAPRFGWREIPLSEPFHDTRAIELQVGPIDHPILHSPSVVNVGNPHCIFWVEDAAVHDLGALGPMLEHHPLFPERANISLAEVRGRDHLVLRVWERGAGLTRACGTAACAAAVSAARKRLTGRKVRVSLPGGDLAVDWRAGDDHMLMTGPFAYDSEGTLPASLLAPQPA